MQAKLLTKELKIKNYVTDYKWFRWEPSIRHIINAYKKIINVPATFTNKNVLETENLKHWAWLNFKRGFLSNPINKRLWISYACFDYFIMYCKKLKKIAKMDVLVVDRYVDDFIIDQAINLSIPQEKCVLIKKKFFLKKFQPPDYTIIIDLPAIEGYSRKNDGTSLSYLESRVKFYEAIRGPNTFHLDGLRSIGSISAEIKNLVLKYLGRNVL